MGGDELHTGRHRSGRAPTRPGGDEPAGATGTGPPDRPDDDEDLLRRLVSVPGTGRVAEIGVGARAVGGLILVVAVVLTVLGGRWWWVEQRATAVPTAQGWVEDGTPAAGGDGVASTEAAASVDPGPVPTTDVAPQPTGPLLVHVVGRVAAPGVVELPPGARVVDAVDAAGGLTREADPGSVNMARAVVDGEQVWVGAPGEEPPAGWVAGAAGDGAVGGASGASGAAEDGPVQLLDLNSATGPELEELPGIGPVTAGHILDWREQHGRFATVEELMEVSGIGERTLEQLEPLVSVGR
ncbi:helix-hairpin-helix domain-containing protein [Serinicoccus kebangsaanensis]|uniref:helix-hairpin-helix domain-containing protein n=1 Tax=Serinicoccus kebangsaanensis TaxID=2602069 RepID=UPI00124CB3F1|nr:helix-hairpin-helix domain-containing protein [Serinicoccus kebangsaanensis]